MPNTVTTITVPDVLVSINDEEDYIDVDVDLCEDDIIDAGDNLGMIIFRDEDDLKRHIEDYVDVEEIFQEKMEEALKSPYYKMKFLDMLKEVGMV